jgi:Trk K+ transport system NAD-binding subunit
MTPARPPGFIRMIRAGWRDTILLLREFRSAIIGFLILIGGFGSLYYFLSAGTGDQPASLMESFFLILTMIFLQPFKPFPDGWYLQLFYFFMPILGIGIMAQGLANFGVMFFNRSARAKEWEMAVASTFSQHVILIGLGHLGYRVVKYLHDLGQDVVVIELQPKDDLAGLVKDLGIPVLIADGSKESVQEAANIRAARSVVLCTQNDSLNLQMALKARSLNPNLDIIVRIFDNDFADALQKQFGFRAISATGMAAPVFAALAAEVDITPPITVDGQPHSVARFKVVEKSWIADKTVLTVEEKFRVSIIMLAREHQSVYHPPAETLIQGGDELAVFGGSDQINQIIHENR